MSTPGKLTNTNSVMPYLLLLRPHHWIKNLFLFLPLFFAGEVFSIDKLMNTLIGFFAFGFIASSIYVINDYKDVEADKLHPEKCTRPIASGAVSKPAALILFFLCLLAGIGIALTLMPKFVFVLGL